MNAVPDRIVIDKSGANLAGLKAVNAHMIRKGQFDAHGLTAFQQFARLAA